MALWCLEYHRGLKICFKFTPHHQGAVFSNALITKDCFLKLMCCLTCSAVCICWVLSTSTPNNNTVHLRRVSEVIVVWSSSQLLPTIVTESGITVAHQWRHLVVSFSNRVRLSTVERDRQRHVRNDGGGVQSALVPGGSGRSLDCCNGLLVVLSGGGSHWTSIRSIRLVGVLFTIGKHSCLVQYFIMSLWSLLDTWIALEPQLS